MQIILGDMVGVIPEGETVGVFLKKKWAVGDKSMMGHGVGWIVGENDGSKDGVAKKFIQFEVLMNQYW